MLTTLVSVSPIYASFDADEQVVVARARATGRAATRAQSSASRCRWAPPAADTPLQGHLQLVDNQVDAKSGTVRVRAVFDNARRQPDAGPVRQAAHGPARRPTPALLVNERAVGTDQNKKFVMVVGADNKAAYREVTLGAHVDGLRIVTAGLKPGERIVVNGLQRVRPGALRRAPAVAMRGRRRASRAELMRVAMNLSRFFIDRPIFAGVLSVLIFLAGLIALRVLPISEYPEVVPPVGRGARQLSRRQPEGDRRDGGDAARGADQRRREHALHEQPGDDRRR